MKKCNKCNIEKDFDDFHKYSNAKDGRKSICKKCIKTNRRLKAIELGIKVRIDKSKDTDTKKTCTKCLSLKANNLFSGNNSWCKTCKKDLETERRRSKGIKEKNKPTLLDNSKECLTCNIILNLTEFSDSKRGSLGKSSYCRSCSRKRARLIPNKTKRQYTQKYRNNNRDWWRSLHRLNQFNRRSLLKVQSDNTVTKELVTEIYKMSICHYCNKTTPFEERTLEHKHPLNKGGSHSKENLTMACSLCNASKRDMTEEEFKNYGKEKN